MWTKYDWVVLRGGLTQTSSKLILQGQEGHQRHRSCLGITSGSWHRRLCPVLPAQGSNPRRDSSMLRMVYTVGILESQMKIRKDLGYSHWEESRASISHENWNQAICSWKDQKPLATDEHDIKTRQQAKKSNVPAQSEPWPGFAEGWRFGSCFAAWSPRRWEV